MNVNKIELISPMYVILKRKTKKDRKIALNMNTYRNLHFQVSNQAKKTYLEAVSDVLMGLVIQTPVEVSYRVLKGSKRRLDKMNVVSIVSKFLFDAMTELGCWEDDNDDNIKTETILPTIYSKGVWGVEVKIKSINEPA